MVGHLHPDTYPTQTFSTDPFQAKQRVCSACVPVQQATQYSCLRFLLLAESGYWETHMGQLFHVRLQGQLSPKLSASKRWLLHSDDTTDHAQGVFEHLAAKGVPRPDLTGLQVLVEGRVPLGKDHCRQFCNANSVALTITFERNTNLDSLCTSLWWLPTPDSGPAVQLCF